MGGGGRATIVELKMEVRRRGGGRGESGRVERRKEKEDVGDGG